MLQRLALIAVTAAALCALGCEDRTTPIDAATLRDSPSPESDAPGLDAPGLDSAIDPGGTATMITAAAGGIARSADGLFEIYVSPGALSEDTTITITRVAPDALPAEVVAASPQTAVYSVEPDGLTFGGDGAFGHFHLGGIPASLVGATGYRGMTAWARQADRPGLERHPESQTVLDLSNDK